MRFVIFQKKVARWMAKTFSRQICVNRQERNHRFLEEALELVQAFDCTKEEAHMLVEYVFGRPRGEPRQEIGGVMVVLAALCDAAGYDMDALADIELARCWENIEKIRMKQLLKPVHNYGD